VAYVCLMEQTTQVYPTSVEQL